MYTNKKLLVAAALCCSIIFMQSFVPKARHDDDKPVNLKILPKDISEEELHKLMRNFSMALGVRCGFCHMSETVPGKDRPKFDFASDAKPEKNIARNMMLMVQGINENYLSKMKGGDHALEQINCVSCHMGKISPMVSVDSLPRKTDSLKRK
jgi:hypothetical protein